LPTATDVLLVFRDGRKETYRVEYPPPTTITYGDSTGTYMFQVTDEIDDKTKCTMYREREDVPIPDPDAS
jgi:hypothetical protein